jgi:hypothetical protein
VYAKEAQKFCEKEDAMKPEFQSVPVRVYQAEEQAQIKSRANMAQSGQFSIANLSKQLEARGLGMRVKKFMKRHLWRSRKRMDEANFKRDYAGETSLAKLCGEFFLCAVFAKFSAQPQSG